MARGPLRFQEIDIPPFIRATLEPGARAYKFGECFVFVAHSAQGWHLSISHPHRYPTWDEIKAARYALTPHNVTMALILPPPEEYVNVHPNCFHLWEIERPKRIVVAR
ncbi:MAG: hypothetical protein H5T97_06985 [Firmicutes bacterium]|nr:hypothetical protein [Bacillota bacterium]